MNPRRVVLAGGTGFIGRALVAEFAGRGFEVVVLTRSPRPGGNPAKEVAWDGAHAGAWGETLEGAEAVVNLAGKNINCPHTPENLREITRSRVESVKAITSALEGLQNPPRVWVQASAVGFYGDTGNVACDEHAPAGSDALAEVCRHWEAAFAAAALPRTRKVTLRIGFVLGRDGGALPVLSRMTKYFLGGAAGSGRQYLSWVHLADLTAMFSAAVTDERLRGTYNAVGPEPVPNAEFMSELRRVLHRPWSPPAPAFAVKWGARLMGSEGSLALVSQRCVARRFAEMGFQYRFPKLEPALKDLIRE